MVLFVYPVDSGAGPQVIKLGGECLYPLTGCMGPKNYTKFLIIDGHSFKTSVAGKW